MLFALFASVVSAFVGGGGIAQMINDDRAKQVRPPYRDVRIKAPFGAEVRKKITANIQPRSLVHVGNGIIHLIGGLRIDLGDDVATCPTRPSRSH